MSQRIRVAMSSSQGDLLRGIVEADETYIGGKPRKGKNKENKRGRETKKACVLGAIEHNGKVVAQVASEPDSLRGVGILRFLKGNVDTKETTLMTDEYRPYLAVRYAGLAHKVVHHVKQFVDGIVHTTNTLEGFWTLLKRAHYGTHHHYNKSWIPFYLSEACWKYNQRKNNDAFWNIPIRLFRLKD